MAEVKNNLFPTGYETEMVSTEELSQSQKTGYAPGLQFDYESGDFKLNGKHRIREATGITSWEDWCGTCLLTERYEHLAYSSDFGIETKEAFAADSHEKAEALLTRQISEALAADPYERTEYVEDIQFRWTAPDTVQIVVTVHGINGVTADIAVEIKR